MTRDQYIAEFASVAASVFRANGWKWNSTGVPNMKVPTKEQIEKRTRELIESLENSQDSNDPSLYVSSGRIQVLYEEDSQYGFYLSLELA